MKRSLLVASLFTLAMTACGKQEAPKAPPAAPAAPAPAPAPAPAQSGMEGMSGMSGGPVMNGQKEEPKK
ncbi:MAG: hypothetical protein K8F53_07890 [Rhodocyclaceae bacterium]|nr:hypothetical protein [Rhodocyclaceae bacterium]